MKKIVIGIFLVILTLFLYNYYSTPKMITSEEAMEIAFKDVANKDNEYNLISIEYKEANENYIYTLKFSDKVNHYIYKINAHNKKILSSKKEVLNNNLTYITEDEVLNIVLQDANLNRSDINLLENKILIEGNVTLYNPIFYYNNLKYSYKVNAYTGSIISVTKLNENAV